eukprot:g6862.t1
MEADLAGHATLEGVDEAPCYYPTTAQFAEPLEYIASIRPDAERHGICRICPPPGWKPQFAHKPDKLKFATKEQDLGKLAGAQRLRRKFTENLRKFLFLIGKPMESAHGGKAERPKPAPRVPAGRGWDYVPDPASYENHSYEQDAWNLNCLPTSDGSLLQFLGTQIQGVMVPWLYVGMAFSAFCWHNEDHYLYSINYLHAGSPKRWYGVPGSMAERFESTVRGMFPELFEAHPDLLMQLERYRLHKRKPVFSHEGLVLSLVDLLAESARNGVHPSGELTGFLRDELEVLAEAQEMEAKKARLSGCTRFEPMEKLVERLRGSTAPATTPASDSNTCSSAFRRTSSFGGDGGKENGCADGGRGGGRGGGGVLEGLESGSAVRGPQCSVCDQYCFLAAVVCNACDSATAGRAPARASSSGSPATGAVGDGGAAAARRRHSRRRFACGRHLADLCPCPASGYTYYRRMDAAQLRRAAKDLTSSEEQTEAWVEEAKAALAVARGAGTGGGLVNSFLLVKAKNGDGGGAAAGGGDGGGGGTQQGAVGNGKVKLEPRNPGETEPYGEDKGATGPPLDDANGSGEEGGAAAAGEAIDETMDLELDASVDEDDDELLPSSLLPAGWRERPSLRYIGDLIRAGEELGAPEHTLDNLRQVVDACAGWVKTIEGILGAGGGGDADGTAAAAAVSLFGTAKRAAAATAAATSHGADDESGRGRGRGPGGRDGGSRSGGAGAGGGARREGSSSSSSSSATTTTTTTKRREQVPFHKAVKLLSTEAKLPGRPSETTERLCVAIIGASQLRRQIRTLLGLGEDEHNKATRAMCLTLQEASRTASPVELASTSVKASPAENGGGGADASTGFKPPIGKPGSSRSNSPCRLSADSGGSGGGGPSSACTTSGGDADTRPGGGGGSEPTGSPRLGSSRTRTRTNVSLPTGTLAAERGTWKGQPWRLWPVHQAAAAALVEPCQASVVTVTELPALKRALASLAERTDRALRLVEAPTESSGVKRGRDRSSLGGGGGGDSSDGGSSGGGGGGGVGPSGTRGRPRGSGGGKVKLSGSPQHGSCPKGGNGAGGGVVSGGAHKRRRRMVLACFCTGASDDTGSLTQSGVCSSKDPAVDEACLRKWPVSAAAAVAGTLPGTAAALVHASGRSSSGSSSGGGGGGGFPRLSEAVRPAEGGLSER